VTSGTGGKVRVGDEVRMIESPAAR
jgi:hypothetical protein